MVFMIEDYAFLFVHIKWLIFVFGFIDHWFVGTVICLNLDLDSFDGDGEFIPDAVVLFILYFFLNWSFGFCFSLFRISLNTSSTFLYITLQNCYLNES